MGSDNTLIVGTNVQEFFRAQVDQAAMAQNLELGGDTRHYLVSLLTGFIRTQALYDRTPDGVLIRPLAELYADALTAPTSEVRNRALKRLGDIALFISGVFPHSFSRKAVDVDYYIAMGGGAYGYLSDVSHETVRWRSLQATFNDLAQHFTAVVDVIAEVCAQARVHDDQDILRVYELWVKTGSTRSARLLRRLGIEPITGVNDRTRH